MHTLVPAIPQPSLQQHSETPYYYNNHYRVGVTYRGMVRVEVGVIVRLR